MILLPCPCGKTPEMLLTTGEHDKPKYAYCYGGCCSMWEIEFRNDYKELGSEESDQKAKDAWNNAPRATKHAKGAAP